MTRVRTSTTLLITAVVALGSGASPADASRGPTASLVKNINTFTQDGPPRLLQGTAGGVFYLDTTSGFLGRFDGSGPGTVIANVVPGCSTDYFFADNRKASAVLDGRLLFAGFDGTHCGLWRSDGTAVGTTLVKHINPSTPGLGGLRQRTLTVAGHTAYLAEDDGEHGMELWRTDGTAAGTQLVKDIAPGAATSEPSAMVAVGETLFFTAHESDTGWQLWRTDGTSAGTTVVEQFSVASGQRPDSLTAVGDALYFAADDGVHGRELWTSDGTTGGTRMVADAQPGEDGSFPAQLTALGAKLLFTATDPDHGRELWSSDGTAAGTALLADVRPGADYGDPTVLTAAAGRLFFAADDGVHGAELWTSDGTGAGTRLVSDIDPGPGGALDNAALLGAPTAIGDTLYFRARGDGVSGGALWRSDGTTAGTRLVSDIVAGGEFGLPYDLTAVDGTLYFGAFTGALASDHAFSLGRSDGTTAGTRTIPVHGTRERGSDPQHFLRAGQRVLFTTGGVLWGSDDTDAGTTRLAELQSIGGDEGGLIPEDVIESGGAVYFIADDGIHGRELWRSDGTASGTRLLRDINPGNDGSVDLGDSVDRWGAELTPGRGAIYFRADDGVHGSELWTSDGTTAGTRMVRDINPGLDASFPLQFEQVGGALYFSAFEPAHARELWRTDGTAAGTRLVKDVDPGPDFTGVPSSLTAVDGTLFFVANEEVHGWELWRSDGTAAGTRIVKDINPSTAADFVYPYGLIAVGDRLVFAGDDGVHGREIWRSDGTSAGTKLVKETVPGPESGIEGVFVSAGATGLFAVNDGVHGSELWRTDGSPGGTKLLKDINPGGEAGFFSSPPTAIGDTFYFAAHDGVHGQEPWVTDGTTAGTRLLADINPHGDGAGFPTFAKVGRSLFFAADDGTHGLEPWRISWGNTHESRSDRCCTS